MHILLCTIGFAGKSAEEFFALLESTQVKQVIDIRQNRGGQLAGFAKHSDLSFFLDKIAHIAYSHEPLLAPAPDLLKAYRKNKNWPSYEAGFLALMNDRGIPQSLDTSAWPSNIALLCSEPTPEKCHRRLVADLLKPHWSNQGHTVEVRHLVAPRPVSTKPRRKKQSASS